MRKLPTKQGVGLFLVKQRCVDWQPCGGGAGSALQGDIGMWDGVDIPANTCATHEAAMYVAIRLFDARSGVTVVENSAEGYGAFLCFSSTAMIDGWPDSNSTRQGGGVQVGRAHHVVCWQSQGPWRGQHVTLRAEHGGGGTRDCVSSEASKTLRRVGVVDHVVPQAA